MLLVAAQLLADAGHEPVPVIGSARWRLPRGMVDFGPASGHLWLACGPASVVDFTVDRIGWRAPVLVHWIGTPMPAEGERLGVWRASYRARSGLNAEADVARLLDAAASDPGALFADVVARPATQASACRPVASEF